MNDRLTDRIAEERRKSEVQALDRMARGDAYLIDIRPRRVEPIFTRNQALMMIASLALAVVVVFSVLLFDAVFSR